MKRITRRSIMLAAVAAILSVVAFFDGGIAQAQCNPVGINNTMTCTVNIRFYDPANGTYTALGIPPGNSVINFPVTFGGAIGVVTPSGNFVPFPSSGACTGCMTFRITGGMGAVCCGQICPGATPCSFTIVPVPCAATCL